MYYVLCIIENMYRNMKHLGLGEKKSLPQFLSWFCAINCYSIHISIELVMIAWDKNRNRKRKRQWLSKYSKYTQKLWTKKKKMFPVQRKCIYLSFCTYYADWLFIILFICRKLFSVHPFNRFCVNIFHYMSTIAV